MATEGGQAASSELSSDRPPPSLDLARAVGRRLRIRTGPDGAEPNVGAASRRLARPTYFSFLFQMAREG